MPTQVAVPPPIEWAQRTDVLFISVAAECKDAEFDFTEDSMHFKATSADGTRNYEVTLNFLHKINVGKVASKNTARRIEFCITKAEPGPYWTTLTTDKKKPHFLRADFNKWRDEDEDNDEDEEGPMGGMGGMPGMAGMGGMPGMGGMGGMGGMAGMAGMGGMGGMGGAGDFGNMQNMFANLNAAGGKPNFDDFGGPNEGEEEDSDDEEIPSLE